MFLYTVSHLRQSALLRTPLGAVIQRRVVTAKAVATVQNIQDQRLLQAEGDEEDAVRGGLLKWSYKSNIYFPCALKLTTVFGL